jgi:two-component system cell cycle sensor histidine kinase/response regulator CckA
LEDFQMDGKPTYEELAQRVEELEKEVADARGAREILHEAQNIMKLLKFAPFGIFLIDLSGRIVACNERGAERLGKTVEKAIGTVLAEYFPSEVSENRMLRGIEAIRLRKPVTFEDQVEGKWYRNSIFPVFDEEGKITQLSIYGVDTTEYKNALEALRESEERLRTIIEHSNELFYMHDTEHVLKYVSSTSQEILGYTPGEMMRKWTELATDNPINDKGIESTEKAISTGKRQSPYLLELRKKDGAVVLLEIDESPVKDAKGEVIGISGAARDVTERRQAEKALIESEERFRHTFENANTGVCLVSTDGRFIKVNDRLCEIFGYSKKELEGMAVNDITHPEDVGLSPEFFKRSISGEMESIVYEKRYIHGKGHVVWGQISSSIVRGLEGEPLYFISHVQDITQQKLAEEALKKSEEKFSKLFQASPAYISLATVEEGRFVAVNDAFTRITGYEQSEVIGRTSREIGLWPDPDDREEFIKQIERYGRRHLQEVTLKRKDGGLIHGLWSVEKIEMEGKAHLISMLIDITEKMRADEALRESEEKYRLLVENANDAIFVAQDGVVKFPNPRTLSTVGYSEDELAKTPFIEFIHPDDRDMVLERYLRRLKGESLPSTYSFRVFDKSGEELWVELNAVLISWEGRPATLNFLRDITEKRHLEAQLRQAQKMEYLGTLAGGIAHDFNNLLMAIQGNVSLMLLRKDPADPDYRRLKNIEEYIQSGAELTRQLLGFARGGRYAVRPTDLNELLKKISDMFGRTRKEVSIHPKYQEGIWPVEADRGQMEQVLMNLYINAWQAMPGGGELFLETENVELGRGFVRPYGVRPGRYVKVAITDTGVGMDEKTLERIFDPFFTTKEMGRGTGLGLASVYGIVKNHGGIINVQSKKSEGATFMIYLPASEGEVVKDEEPREEVLRGEETILLVDDEEMIIDAGKEMLEEMGYRVITATSGQEAIDLFKKRKDEIDMVILDMVMPAVGGGKTYDRLKGLDPDVRVLLSSGYSMDGEAAEILKRGCNGFIQKPFDMKEISNKIREILDQR